MFSHASTRRPAKEQDSKPETPVRKRQRGTGDRAADVSGQGVDGVAAGLHEGVGVDVLGWVSEESEKRVTPEGAKRVKPNGGQADDELPGGIPQGMFCRDSDDEDAGGALFAKWVVICFSPSVMSCVCPGADSRERIMGITVGVPGGALTRVFQMTKMQGKLLARQDGNFDVAYHGRLCIFIISAGSQVCHVEGVGRGSRAPGLQVSVTMYSKAGPGSGHLQCVLGAKRALGSRMSDVLLAAYFRDEAPGKYCKRIEGNGLANF